MKCHGQCGRNLWLEKDEALQGRALTHRQEQRKRLCSPGLCNRYVLKGVPWMNGDPGLMHLITLAELLEKHLAWVLNVLSLVQSSPLRTSKSNVVKRDLLFPFIRAFLLQQEECRSDPANCATSPSFHLSDVSFCHCQLCSATLHWSSLHSSYCGLHDILICYGTGWMLLYLVCVFCL